MSKTYRTDDFTRWGAGIGVALSSVQVDLNFWDSETRLTALEALGISAAVGIDYITQNGNSFTFHMSDHTLEGPFTIPTAQWNPRGQWQPSTPYSPFDVFYFNGSLYLCVFATTGQSSFDPNANDGFGHNFYALIIPEPANVLPAGGSTGTVLSKASGTDFDVYWQVLHGIPPGGFSGDVLTKHSSSDYDAIWETPSFVPVTSINTVAIPFVIDGGGSAITTGVKGSVQVPFNGTITEVTMLADQSGSVVVDIWNCTFGAYSPPTTPTVSNKITGADTPTISSATKMNDTALTGWTTTVAAGDILTFNVNSASTVTRVTIELTVEKT